MWTLDKLQPYDRNPMQHPDDQVADIARSIEKWGFNNPILVGEDGSIIAGHGRLMAAQQLEMEKVPVIVLEHLSANERRAYLLADNELARRGSWDHELLAIEVGELAQLPDIDITALGFTEEALGGLVTAAGDLAFLGDGNGSGAGSGGEDGDQGTGGGPGATSELVTLVLTMSRDERQAVLNAVQLARKIEMVDGADSQGTAVALLCEQFMERNQA